MPWRNLPEWFHHLPDWVQWALGLLGMLSATMMGAMAKIADDVKKGHRDKFWTANLFLELPALGMMYLVALGLAAWWDLPDYVNMAVAVLLGWGGPKLVEAIIAAKLPNLDRNRSRRE
jgi:hypothetical protein